MLTIFLQEVAEGFHKFYDLYRVLGDNEQLMQARLGLIEATKQVLAAGFDLLGVSKPEKM
jgi:arginyl-tRNA synthetase